MIKHEVVLFTSDPESREGSSKGRDHGLSESQRQACKAIDAATWRAGWSESTAQMTCVDVRAVLRSGRIGNARQYASIRRILRTFDLDAWASGPHAAVLATLIDAEKAYQVRRRQSRSLRSYDDEAWRKLVALLSEHVRSSRQPNEAAALYLLLRTGLRVGDVLRLERSALIDPNGVLRPQVHLTQKGGRLRSLDTQGAIDAWELVVRLWGVEAWSNFALFVTYGRSADVSAAAAAYKRILRLFQKLAEQAGLEPPWRLHRIRRTVAVQALRLSGDLPAVQQLLGHRTFKTTLGYLDEARTERVTELQTKLLNIAYPETTKSEKES